MLPVAVRQYVSPSHLSTASAGLFTRTAGCSTAAVSTKRGNAEPSTLILIVETRGSRCTYCCLGAMYNVQPVRPNKANARLVPTPSDSRLQSVRGEGEGRKTQQKACTYWYVAKPERSWKEHIEATRHFTSPKLIKPTRVPGTACTGLPRLPVSGEWCEC